MAKTFILAHKRWVFKIWYHLRQKSYGHQNSIWFLIFPHCVPSEWKWILNMEISKNLLPLHRVHKYLNLNSSSFHLRFWNFLPQAETELTAFAENFSLVCLFTFFSKWMTIDFWKFFNPSLKEWHSFWKKGK